MLEINKIHQMDVIDGLQHIPIESCDIIIADPPYNIGKDFGLGKYSDKLEMTDYLSWCQKWITQCKRILKPNATFFIYGFSEILAHIFVNIEMNKRWLVWHYLNKNSANGEFWQRSHESIIACWKEKPIFNTDLVREPYTETFLNNSAGKVRKGMASRFGSKETIYNADPNGALPRDVIKLPTLAGGSGSSERWFICKTCESKVFHPHELEEHATHDLIKHPTQKTLEISERLLKSAMPKENGLVVVPFAGSGSECVAAKNLNMSFIAFEINPDYIKIASTRLAEDKYQIEKTKQNLNNSELFT